MVGFNLDKLRNMNTRGLEDEIRHDMVCANCLGFHPPSSEALAHKKCSDCGTKRVLYRKPDSDEEGL